MADDQTKSGPPPAPSISEVIDNGILRAVFQPIVDLYTDRPIGWEAFARVGDVEDDRGFDRWLSSAEDAGLGLAFQYSALHAIGAVGPPPDDGILFVNVGADLLADDRLLEECAGLGARVAVDIRGSEIEQVENLSAQLDDLVSADIHLSIDDTTAASLAMIARVRPSFVKIDSALVRDIIHDPVPRSVIRAYLAFAESEEIHVIAEGVERHDQLEVLRDLGVRFAQGYLFGRPTESWTQAAPRRRRPSLSLDSGRDARRRFEFADDMRTVAEIACSDLRAAGLLPSFYIEREGVLRCIAQLGYWQVLDGIPVGVGVMSKAFRSGRPQITSPEESAEYVGAVPGIIAEMAVPVRVGSRTVGVLNVESTTELGEAALEEIQLVALAMEERLTVVGAGVEDSALHRLARSNTELSMLTEVGLIETAVARMACEISGLSSGLLAMPSVRDMLEVKALQGPLSPDLRNLAGHVLTELANDVELVSGCLSSGDDEGLSKPAMAMLRAGGASSIAAFPLRSSELGQGLLVLADHAPIELGLAEREALECLAREAGRSLDMAVVMADLRARATRDTLTGLGNLAAFQDALSAIGGRRRGRWAVAMADVDGFKAVNDTYGHLTGDRILRELAASIDTVLRAEDRMYRIGGDEFAAILHDVDETGARDVGNRMCEAAEAIMGEFGAGLSVGIALPAPYELATEFLDRADKTLYAVKREAPGTARVAPAVPDDAETADEDDEG